MALTLYHFNNSVCSQKVRLALAEKGTKWDERFVDLVKLEQYEFDYVQLNPKGVVPTLVHDGQVVIESTLICEYLDDIKGSTNLIGTAPKDRAVTRMWTRRISLNICEAMTTAFRGAEGYEFFKDRLRLFFIFIC